MVISRSPGSRECSFLARRSERNVLLCCFVAEDKLLFQMRSGWTRETYWSLIDSDGNVLRMPRTLHRVLCSSDWSSLKSQPIQGGLNQLLLMSGDKISVVRLSDLG